MVQEANEMNKTNIRWVRLDDTEDTIAQEVADLHRTSLAAAIRFIIREWKRLALDEQDWIDIVKASRGTDSETLY